MFNYKYPLLEVVQAIEHLQEAKGMTNTQICEFVGKRTKKAVDPMKVIKTMCTLNKLVEEGVLVKKGKRYSIPKPPPKEEENDEEETMEEEKDDDDCDMKDSCDDLGGDDDDEGEGEEDCPESGGDEDDCNNGDDDNDNGNEDDDDDCDDDDDDDDDSDVEDDDDDDEGCNDKMESPSNDGNKKDDRPLTEGGDLNNEEEKDNRNENGTARDSGNGSREKDDNDELNCATSLTGVFPVRKGSAQKKGRSKYKKPSQGINVETIAFCARDFMDAQHRPYSNGPANDGFAKVDDVMEEDLDVNEKSKEVSNIFQARRRGTRSKPGHVSRSSYRSRSPVKRAPPTDPFQQRLAMEPSDDIRSLNCQMFQEAAGMELDLDPVRQSEVGTDMYRKSPVDISAPDVDLNRKESCCSNQDKKEAKPELGLEGVTQCEVKRFGESMASMIKGKPKIKKEFLEAKKERHKRDGTHHKSLDHDMYESLCSVCEKKKRKKRN